MPERSWRGPVPARPDVIVVGAGVSGLACAADLTAAGLEVLVLEASDSPGGRMRTDHHDGFLLDRGFQVFNTGYPQVRRRMGGAGPRMHPFTPGVVLATGRGHLRFGAPVPRPSAAATFLRGGLGPLGDVPALGLLSARDALAPASVIKAGPDITVRRALAEAGISDVLVERFFRPFLSGVFLEPDLATSARVFHLVWRSMLRGSLCLPAGGIGAVPRWLAAGLPEGTVRTGCPVREVTDEGVLTEDGAEIGARIVVVATEGSAAARLVPGVPSPRNRTVTTYYHASERSPLAEPTLLLDSARHRFLNSCVLSEVAPGCAPPGVALISTSVLGEDRPGREAELRVALGDAYGVDASAWEALRAVTVRGALPAMEPPQPLGRTTRVSPGRYVCGDHRATGSVQGAMASGARAAREVLVDVARAAGLLPARR
ncbi:NAD(P)/FAD-dependent oxidoreductase [Streptomyces alkaliphilus]|uniref:NAD(P)/FAD-dependent oxidoreductase n=1 Tax=Streptomyces alkaliphilus TaxID=1472722 RepID=UPI00117C1B34|nr:NAD(P)/FAD-dependent oxidoreductase [Streptomyces alkaliphilus]MQS08464.1 FAD-dependent oxidoreductase [Streptomyces alkaliphilus]